MMSKLIYPPERLTRDGAVIISHNHLCFLHGLLDRPSGVARSSRDLHRAALPYTIYFRSSLSLSCLAKASCTLNVLWVGREVVGNRIEWSLTERGRAMLTGMVRVRIPGFGEYQGLQALRRGRST